MEITDVYILLETFKTSDVVFFRENYIKGFLPSADYFEYPQYENETIFETSSADEMLDFMLKDNKGLFQFYFRNPNPTQPRGGMIFFNTDNTLLLGVGVHSEFVDLYTDRLKNDFHSQAVMYCNEMPPPSNSVDFKRVIGLI